MKLKTIKMKVHNDLKELLTDFLIKWINESGEGFYLCDWDEEFIDKYKSDNILALGKKDDNYICPNGCGQNGDAGSCFSCVGK